LLLLLLDDAVSLGEAGFGGPATLLTFGEIMMSPAAGYPSPMSQIYTRLVDKTKQPMPDENDQQSAQQEAHSDAPICKYDLWNINSALAQLER